MTIKKLFQFNDGEYYPFIIYRFAHPISNETLESFKKKLTCNKVLSIEASLDHEERIGDVLQIKYTWELRDREIPERDLYECEEVETGLEKYLPLPLVNIALDYLSFDEFEE